MKKLLLAALCAGLVCAARADQSVASPDGKIKVTVSDSGALAYRVEVDGKAVLNSSRLGLEFADGTTLGSAAKIDKAKTSKRRSSWRDDFGPRKTVSDRWNQVELTLSESGRTFGVIVRAYDDGVAFRYDLPVASKLGEFTLTRELTDFNFAEDNFAFVGEESDCAENNYVRQKLSGMAQNTDAGHGGGAYKSVLPLLVQTPGCAVAVAESDLRDWAGMFVTGTGSPRVAVTLAPRGDGSGCVVSQTPRVSPWRVLMIARTAADLVNSDLIANLATPSVLKDTSWIKPGVSAWDPWWTGVNPNLPDNRRGLWAGGDTKADKEYINLASELGWQYQLVDWMWYKDCTGYQVLLNMGQEKPARPPVHFEVFAPEMDIPALLQHAKEKNVKLLMWVHSWDIERYGIEKACALFANWGVAGLKIDFMNNDNQETVAWYEKVISTAAKHKLLIDFHGAYKATGLARTYPNYITQEGVLGNEYNKINTKCTPLHTITLPFTRGLLGPMDFTPGGFISRLPSKFEKDEVPATVMGTRARQLAMPVIYFSPLTVMCDGPDNYRGKPGIEYYRNLPTVWDETVVLDAEIAGHLVLARRSGDRWWLAGMNGDNALTLRVPLKFLGKGKWTLRSFADTPESAIEPNIVAEKTTSVTAGEVVELNFAPAGGYAAVLTKEK